MICDAFERFLSTHRADLMRISRATRGEASAEDVHAEAWLLVADLQAAGRNLDLDLIEHRQFVLARLYQHLVRYTELHVRYAVRLDHAPAGEEGEVHPLARSLASGEQSDPAVALMHAQAQEQAKTSVLLNPHQSLASAYVRLLEHLDYCMPAVAAHLLISLSYCYRRCAHARIMALHQHALPATTIAHQMNFVPRPWRHFRLKRPPIQLSLDLDCDSLLL